MVERQQRLKASMIFGLLVTAFVFIVLHATDVLAILFGTWPILLTLVYYIGMSLGMPADLLWPLGLPVRDMMTGEVTWVYFCALFLIWTAVIYAMRYSYWCVIRRRWLAGLVLGSVVLFIIGGVLNPMFLSVKKHDLAWEGCAVSDFVQDWSLTGKGINQDKIPEALYQFSNYFESIGTTAGIRIHNEECEMFVGYTAQVPFHGDESFVIAIQVNARVEDDHVTDDVVAHGVLKRRGQPHSFVMKGQMPLMAELFIEDLNYYYKHGSFSDGVMKRFDSPFAELLPDKNGQYQ